MAGTLGIQSKRADILNMKVNVPGKINTFLMEAFLRAHFSHLSLFSLSSFHLSTYPFISKCRGPTMCLDCAQPYHSEYERLVEFIKKTSPRWLSILKLYLRSKIILILIETFKFPKIMFPDNGLSPISYITCWFDNSFSDIETLFTYTDSQYNQVRKIYQKKVKAINQ